MLAFPIALSGLAVQAQSLAVSADNVANLRSAGIDPAAPAGAPGYLPRRVAALAQAGGGVRGEALPLAPASVALRAPDDPRADAKGVVHLANVALEQELVTQMIAARLFAANLEVIASQDEMLGRLLDLKS